MQCIHLNDNHIPAVQSIDVLVSVLFCFLLPKMLTSMENKQKTLLFQICFCIFKHFHNFPIKWKQSY